MSPCSEVEARRNEGLSYRLTSSRLLLPDHRADRLHKPEKLQVAIEKKCGLLGAAGPVFVHCMAAMERWRLVCLALMVGRYRHPFQGAVDYLVRVNSGTNPLCGQAELVDGSDKPIDCNSSPRPKAYIQHCN